MYRQRLQQDRVDIRMWPKPDPESTRTATSMESTADPGREFSDPKRQSGDDLPAAVTTASVPRGAYRRLLCYPKDVSWAETAPWTDQNSLDKNHANIAKYKAGEDNASGAMDAITHDVEDGSHAGGTLDDISVKPEEGSTGREMADVRVSFALPPGSFATMFLREVMKRNDDIATGGEREESEAVS